MKKLILSLMIGISCASAMDETANKKTNPGNTIVVSGGVSLSENPEIAILMDAGTYPKSVIDYEVLQTGGTLSTVESVSWVSPTQTSYKIETSEDGRSLVLKAHVPTEGDENN